MNLNFVFSVASRDSTSTATFMAMLVFCNQGDAKAEINVLLSHLKDLYADKMLKGKIVYRLTSFQIFKE